MKDLSVEVGRVVLSKAGRDKGNFFVITDILDENYVIISDGVKRKLKSSKKKKLKHLELKPVVLDEIAKKIEVKRLLDSDIEKALKEQELIS